MTWAHKSQCPNGLLALQGANQGFPPGAKSVSNILKGSQSNEIGHKT